MSRHFIDHSDHISRQTFSAAVILNSAGTQVGKIIVRFTPSQVGLNHEVGVIFHPAGIDYASTMKGGTYSQPSTLIELLDANGVKSYAWSGDLIISSHRAKAGEVSAGSLSQFNDVASLKHGRKTYRVLWAL